MRGNNITLNFVYKFKDLDKAVEIMEALEESSRS